MSNPYDLTKSSQDHSNVDKKSEKVTTTKITTKRAKLPLRYSMSSNASEISSTSTQNQINNRKNNNNNNNNNGLRNSENSTGYNQLHRSTSFNSSITGGASSVNTEQTAANSDRTGTTNTQTLVSSVLSSNRRHHQEKKQMVKLRLLRVVKIYFLFFEIFFVDRDRFLTQIKNLKFHHFIFFIFIFN